MQQQPDIWRPAIISGAIFGFVSGMPIIGALNCLCCSLILAAGVMCSFMMVRASAVPLAYGHAALGGFVTGVVAALVNSFMTGFMLVVSGASLKDRIEESSHQMQQYLPNAEEASRMISSVPGYAILTMLALILLVIYAPFGAVGGVIGRALFERRTPAGPAPPPPAPPVEPAP